PAKTGSLRTPLRVPTGLTTHQFARMSPQNYPNRLEPPELNPSTPRSLVANKGPSMRCCPSWSVVNEKTSKPCKMYSTRWARPSCWLAPQVRAKPSKQIGLTAHQVARTSPQNYPNRLEPPEVNPSTPRSLVANKGPSMRCCPSWSVVNEKTSKPCKMYSTRWARPSCWLAPQVRAKPSK